jgi:hypothetical protein
VPIERYEHLLNSQSTDVENVKGEIGKEGKEENKIGFINEEKDQKGGQTTSDIDTIDTPNLIEGGDSNNNNNNNNNSDSNSNKSSISESKKRKIPPPPPGIPNKIKKSDFRWLTLPKHK